MWSPPSRSTGRAALLGIIRRPAGALVRRAMSSSSSRPWSGASTTAVHGDASVADLYTHAHDVAPPIGVSTTFERFADEAESPSPYNYSRASVPTRERCEAVLGGIESHGGVDATATLYGSGLAAVHGAIGALLAQTPPTTGRRLRISGGYHGTHEVARALIDTGAPLSVAPLPTLDADGHLVDGEPLAPGDICWLETPKNPTAELADVAAYAALARGVPSNRECDVVVDATLAPPPLQFPLASGARLVVHSATKALAGHSDALAGVVVAASSDAELTALLRRRRAAEGGVPGSLETWLLLRSLRTLELRVARQSASADALAAWLRENGGASVVAVHRADTATRIRDSWEARQMPRGVGCVLAVELRTERMARALPQRLRLFKDATSLGGVESLAEWRRQYDDGVSPLLVRLSIGLEDAADLIADFDQALAALEHDELQQA